MIIHIPKYFNRKDIKAVGIYFLIKNNKVVYIGKSIDVLCRVFYGGARIDFDFVRVIECDFEKLNLYEKRWIIKFRPKHNKAHLFKWVGGWRPGGRIRKRVRINYKE